MGERYSVNRQSMREAAEYIETAAGRWEQVKHCLGYCKLGNDDLGIIGRKAGVPKEYNQNVDAIWQKSQKGVQRLQAMMLTLEATAKAYGHAEQKSMDEMKKVFKEL